MAVSRPRLVKKDFVLVFQSPFVHFATKVHETRKIVSDKKTTYEFRVNIGWLRSDNEFLRLPRSVSEVRKLGKILS